MYGATFRLTLVSPLLVTRTATLVPPEVTCRAWLAMYVPSGVMAEALSRLVWFRLVTRFGRGVRMAMLPSHVQRMVVSGLGTSRHPVVAGVAGGMQMFWFRAAEPPMA